MSFLTPYLLPITVLAAVGVGLMAGLLFAFSNFVMKALTQLAPAQGMRAMQLINVTILNPVFLLLFLGTALLCVLILLHALMHLQSPASVWLLAGTALYLLGTVGVTMALNVPLNNLLAAVEPTTSKAAELWPSYVAQWLRWNHVRTLMSVASALSLTYAAAEIR